MRIITRAEWGAKYPDGFRDRPMPITEWWLHHSVTIAPDLVPPFTDDDAAVRTLERIGQQRFGGGISYTYPVTPVGRLYQGHSLHRQGAHTLGHNTVAGAFVLVGDYRKKPPTEAMREAIARRMVEDHRAGKAIRHTLNGGHRQASRNVGTTECPGDAAIAAIPAINARANELWAAGYPNTPVPEEDDMPSAAEVADEILKRPVYDSAGNKLDVGRAIGITLRNSTRAAIDATVARNLAEASAKAAAPLSDADVQRIAEAAAREVGEGFTVEGAIVPKDGAQ